MHIAIVTFLYIIFHNLMTTLHTYDWGYAFMPSYVTCRLIAFFFSHISSILNTINIFNILSTLYFPLSFLLYWMYIIDKFLTYQLFTLLDDNQREICFPCLGANSYLLRWWCIQKWGKTTTRIGRCVMKNINIENESMIYNKLFENIWRV